jgi:predicted DNA-binding transcriptional regulator AlpA
MTSPRTEIAILPHLPDHVVLSKQQACSITSLSEDTLGRLHRRGEGPARIQLSPRRVGYTVGALRSWLQKRST